MSNVCAFIVGVDRYDHSDAWTLRSASANAILFAEILLKIGVVEHRNVYLFLDTEHKKQIEWADQLAASNVNVERSAKYERIDTFWRKELRQMAAEGSLSRLFFYWSGHGFIDKDDRILVCRDFVSPQLANRVLDLTTFLSQLRSPAYQGFSEQIGFVDACAVHSAKTEFDPNRTAPKSHSDTTRQVVFFAAPEGDYAYEDSGEGEIGVFTLLIRPVLESFGGWPQADQLWDAMEAGFKEAKQNLYRVTCMDPRKELSHHMVGVHRSNNSVVESVYELLSPLAVPDSVYQPHYLKTVSDLGDPELYGAQGITGMIKELASLGDGGERSQTYGLLQFLVRLTAEDSLKDPIEEWLGENAVGQGNSLANIREKIAIEAESNIFVIDVVNDANGEIESFELYLRSNNLNPIPGFKPISRRVGNWDDFCKTLLADINQAKELHAVEDFELQFLVDPPLFHHQFHTIAPDWEEHRVLVRYRRRVHSRNKRISQMWMDYADEIRNLPPGDVPVLKVDPKEMQEADRQKGLCYMASLMCAARSSREKDAILQLLRTGTPYIYWLHELRQTKTFDEIQGKFQQWLGAIGNKTIHDFPEVFTTERIRGEDFARNATLLWDDPRFNPFQKNGA